MPKKILTAFLLVTSYALLVTNSFPAEEYITITTYYPAPYGSYNEFETASNTWLAYSSGNVGIGTASPGYTLQVQGNAYCNTGWAGSDLRWKKNIATLDDPLSKLSRLRGVAYDWRCQEFKANHFPEGRQIGIIAQEMEKEYPELVNTDKGGYKAIAYDRFTAVLLEAIKAQAGKMEAQQKEIEGLKQEIQSIKGKL